jgi:hypothetical protein
VTRSLLVVCVLLIGLAGCSGADGSPSGGSGLDPAQQTEIRDGLAAHFAGDHPDARKRDAAACFARTLLEETGAERLRDAAVLDADLGVVPELPLLPEDLAEDWAAAQLTCTDYVDESTRAQLVITKGRVDDEAYAGCLRAALTEEQMRDALVDTLTGDWSAVGIARLGRAQTDCAAEAAPR